MNNSVLGRDFSLRSKWHSLFVISITTKLLFFASRYFLTELSEERSPATASHIKCSFTLNFSLLTFYLSLPLSSRTRLSWGISKNHTALKKQIYIRCTRMRFLSTFEMTFSFFHLFTESLWEIPMLLRFLHPDAFYRDYRKRDLQQPHHI